MPYKHPADRNTNLRERYWDDVEKSRASTKERVRRWRAKNAKPSRAAYHRLWRKLNPERVLEQRKRRQAKQSQWQRDNREKVAAYQARYYLRNRAKRIADMRAWRKKNPEKWLASRRKWLKTPSGQRYYERQKFQLPSCAPDSLVECCKLLTQLRKEQRDGYQRNE